MEDFNKRFGQFLERVNEKAQESYAGFHKACEFKDSPFSFAIEAQEGPKYIRLVRVEFFNGERTKGGSAFGFVDKTNGNVLKAAGWKAPAKNFARGNIFAEDFGLGRVYWTSIS